MPYLRGYLRRFRRIAAPPGRAAPVTVPVDRVADRRAEVAALLAAIDEIEEAAERIERNGEEQARASRSTVSERTGHVLAAAREQAEAARTEAYTARRQQREQELQAELEAAEAAASGIRLRAAEWMPELVAEVLRCVSEAGAEERGARRRARSAAGRTAHPEEHLP